MGWSEYYDEYTIEFTEHQLEEHDEEIRAKVIEEFVNLLVSDEVQKYELDAVFETCTDLSYSACCGALEDYVRVCAEQIKEQSNDI